MPKRILAAIAVVLFAALPARAEFSRPIRFPVDGPASFTDTFNDGRSGGRVHEGIDIMADKMIPAVSAIDGRVRWLTEEEQSYGWMVVLEDFEGYTYREVAEITGVPPGTANGRLRLALAKLREALTGSAASPLAAPERITEDLRR